MPPCRECAKRTAVPGAADSWLVLPLRLFGLPRDGDGWCLACANELKGFGIIVWSMLITAALWLLGVVVAALESG